MRRALFTVGIMLLTSAQAQKTTISFWNFDTNAVQKQFWADQIKKFEAQNPTISIQYTAHPSNQYDNALELAIRGGNMPDVVDVRDQGAVYRYVNRGLFQPLDPYINQAWLNRFNAGDFLTGLHKFGGKVYSYPYRDERINGVRTLVFYNKKLLADAGVKTLPTTWAEMRQAAKAVTEKSKGNAYGFMMPFLQSGTENTVAAFAASAGQPNGGALGGFYLRGLNLKTGKYDLSGEPFSKTVDFLSSLVKDGSMLPGYETSTNDQGVALFAQGRVAMLTGPGFWAIPAVDAAKPNFEWEIGLPPSPDGKVRPLHISPAAGRIFMSAKTKNAQASWKWIDFMTSTPFLQAMVESGISFPDQPAAYTNAKVDPMTKKVLSLAKTNVVLAPAVEVQSSLTPAIFAKIKPPQPVDLDIWRGAISGRLNYADAAKTYDNYMNSQLDAAIKAISPRSERSYLFAFPKWNISQSFELKDYTRKSQ